jgi:hypothetical protein
MSAFGHPTLSDTWPNRKPAKHRPGETVCLWNRSTLVINVFSAAAVRNMNLPGISCRGHQFNRT